MLTLHLVRMKTLVKDLLQNPSLALQEKQHGLVRQKERREMRSSTPITQPTHQMIWDTVQVALTQPHLSVT